MTVFIATESHW